jgi:hypothetical protein
MSLSDEGRHRQIWEHYPILGSKVGRNPVGKPNFDHTGSFEVHRIERLLAAAFLVKEHAGSINVGQTRGDREKLLHEFWELGRDLESYGEFLKDLADEIMEVGAKCTRVENSNL